MDEAKYDAALKVQRKGNMKQAEQMWTALIEEEPEDAIYQFQLGALYTQTGNFPLASICLRHAIVLKPRFSEAHSNLGTCYKFMLDGEQAKKHYKRALLLEPENKDALVNILSMFVNEGKPSEAFPYYKKLIAIDPDNAKAHWNYSLSLLEQGQYEEGFKMHEYGFDAGERPKRFYDKKNNKDGSPDSACPEWDGTKGKTVIVYGEQGLGDELMFASILPDMMKDCDVILDCHPRLVDIFKRSFPKLKAVYGTRKEEWIEWTDDHKYDAKIAIGSLGKFYRNKREDFPVHNGYLRACPHKVEKYTNKLRTLGDKPKIGIHWQGGKKKTRHDLRSTSLEGLLPILSQDATFISLQYTDCLKEINAFETKHDIRIYHWQDAIDDYDECAALVESLDLVISVCTSVVHLAGALNKTTICLTPSKPAWRYLVEGEKMDWYDSVAMYRQGKDGWKPVIGRLAADFNNYLKGGEPAKEELATGELAIA